LAWNPSPPLEPEMFVPSCPTTVYHFLIHTREKTKSHIGPLLLYFSLPHAICQIGFSPLCYLTNPLLWVRFFSHKGSSNHPFSPMIAYSCSQVKDSINVFFFFVVPHNHGGVGGFFLLFSLVISLFAFLDLLFSTISVSRF